MVIEEQDEDRSAKDMLSRIYAAEKVFSDYNALCDTIDDVYSDRRDLNAAIADLGLTDRRFDLFWASMEVLKPAIYCKPPRVVVKPRFSGANATDKVVAEMLERVVNSEFERGHIDDSLKMARDDLALTNRGVLWLSLGDDKDIYPDWLDREDFLHEPARYWREVGWAARRSWLTIDEMRDRFKSESGDAYLQAFFARREEGSGYRGVGGDEVPEKAAVWEIWDKRENRVYWVSEGVEDYLDEQEPYLNLSDFFPCPRPAYGTLARRTLIPRPDYVRYAPHLDQINELTRRIYELLDQVRMRGLIAGGGDVANAVETAMRENSSSSILISVPGAALLAGSGASNMVQWVPLDMLAQTIQGLIDARERLFADFDLLSGISDIMRGETDAAETLGAQRLKGQYGSVRVRDKIDEMVRLSRDAAFIAGEIICENYSKDRLMEVAQMELPTRKEVDKAISDAQRGARQELKALEEKFEQQAQQAMQSGEAQEVDPQQVQQAFQQAQQQILAKWEPKLHELRNTVVIEDVMRIVKDERARGLIIDIETDSTVMTDELAEKETRAEFLNAFANATGAVQPLIAMGENGAALAGGIFKFALQPYNTNRELEALIDNFVEEAPAMAAAQGEGEGEAEGLVEAQLQLAEAEQQKAQAQMAKVQADSQLKQAEMQRKVAEMQTKAQNDQMKAQMEAEKLRQALADTESKLAKTDAEIDKIRAETAKILNSIGLDVRKQDLDEYQAAEQSQRADVDQAARLVGQATAGNEEEPQP